MKPTSSLVLLFGALSSAVVGALDVKPHVRGSRRSAPTATVLQLANFEDMSFSCKLALGDQVLDVIPDTGSFELVVFSDFCKSCGDAEKTFHAPENDSSFSTGPHHTTQHYGSGDTTSQEAYFSVALRDDDGKDHLRVARQMFWMTVDADLAITEASSFQGIFGLGAPDSAVEMAQMEVAETARALKKMSPDEQQEYAGLLQTLKKTAAFTKSINFWHEQQQMRAFSFCLQPVLGMPGAIIFHDTRPKHFPSHFVNVPSEGRYWQVPLNSVHVPGVDGTRHRLGCTTGAKCAAVMDTGTSLIGAPLKFVRHMEELVEQLSEKYGCEDLTSWPALELTLGEETFKLGPASYVALYQTLDEEDDISKAGAADMRRINDHGDKRLASEAQARHRDLVEKRLPYLKDFRRKHLERRGLIRKEGSNDFLYCAPNVFVLEETVDKDTEMWLFGLPFFREYYTTFHLAEGSRRSESMSFARANELCETVHEEEFENGNLSMQIPLVVNLDQVRFPEVLTRESTL